MRHPILVLTALAALLPGVGASADEWVEIRAGDVATLAAPWKKPVSLGVNAYGGWIDSLHVSEDGKTIYYMFYPGPDLISDSRTGNFRGDADIYVSHWPFDTHAPVDAHFMSEQPWAACCVQLDRQGQFWYQSNREARPGGSAEGNTEWHPVYRGEELLAFNGQDRHFEDPFYCPTRDELWMADAGDPSLLRMLVLKGAGANGFAGEPLEAQGPMRNGGQPYLTPNCNTMYFAANLGDVPSEGPAIYRTTRKRGRWSRAAPVVFSRTGVGEPTLTADGRKLFFVQLFTNGRGEYRIGAFVATRK